MAEIRVPTLGESVTEATIGKWFKKPGEAVAVDEPLVELETDKVTIEVPAPAAGVLSDIAAKDSDSPANASRDACGSDYSFFSESVACVNFGSSLSEAS